jgi:hypothetical protein
MSARPFRFRSHTGQAMVEFLIVSTLVLVPLFLAVPLLGKFLDLKSTAIQAARYAAWERTVWYGGSDWSAGSKDDAMIQREIRQRFFSNTATNKLQAGDGNMAGWDGGPKPLWRDRAGNPMLVNYDSDVAQATPASSTPGTLNDILTPVVEVIDTVDKILGAEFKLHMNSLYKASVSVQTQPTRPIRQVLGGTASLETFSGVAPLFNETNVMVANGWNANGPDHVKKQVEGLTPTSVAQRDPVKTALEVIQYFTAIIAPELMPDHLKLGGEIQPDVVPGDRLK